MTQNIEELVHHFHSEYRKSGIALCISLAALATSESWWFYGFYTDLGKSGAEKFQYFIWCAAVLTAVAVLIISFYVQYQHYFGMRNESRAMYLRWEGKDYSEKHSEATEFFDKADRWVPRLCLFHALH